MCVYLVFSGACQSKHPLSSSPHISHSYHSPYTNNGRTSSQDRHTQTNRRMRSGGMCRSERRASDPIRAAELFGELDPGIQGQFISLTVVNVLINRLSRIFVLPSFTRTVWSAMSTTFFTVPRAILPPRNREISLK